jgi:hypothetical protein
LLFERRLKSGELSLLLGEEFALSEEFAFKRTDLGFIARRPGRCLEAGAHSRHNREQKKQNHAQQAGEANTIQAFAGSHTSTSFFEGNVRKSGPVY